MEADQANGRAPSAFVLGRESSVPKQSRGWMFSGMSEMAIGAPLARSAAFTACLSARGITPAGGVMDAKLSPDISAITRSSAVRPLRQFAGASGGELAKDERRLPRGSVSFVGPVDRDKSALCGNSNSGTPTPEVDVLRTLRRRTRTSQAGGAVAASARNSSCKSAATAGLSGSCRTGCRRSDG